jgi:membrane-associated phospholipid phosphatase
VGSSKRAVWLAAFVLVGPLAGRALAQDVAPVSTGAATDAAGAAAARKVVLGYKPGEWWPLSAFEGADLVEPFLPIAAASRGDWGRLTLNTALPYALLVSSFAFQSKDNGTLAEIGRWKWVGIDEASDNYPMLYGLVSLAGVTLLLPAPEDGDGYSWHLRLDRALVFGLGIGIANLETELLKNVFDRVRPNGEGHASRPSGHASTAFAAMAFMSDVLRDTFRPEEAPNLGLRVVEEVGCAVPYLGAGYMALERVHAKKHYLTDTLLGGALGAFTMNLFYSWSFTRTEQGRSWLELASAGYNSEQKGFEVALRGDF